MVDITFLEHIMLMEEKILRLLRFLKNSRVIINRHGGYALSAVSEHQGL